MANAEKITELIDEKALLNWEKFVDSLEKAQNLMATTAMQAAEINRAMGQAKNMAQYSKSAEQAALAQEKIRQAAIRTQQAEERLAAQRKKQQQADERYSRQEAARQKRQEAQTKRLNSEYARLDAELTKVRTRAQDVAAQMFRMEQAGRTNEKAYQRLQTRFENLSRITGLLDGRLKQIDSTLGKSQRYVGEYQRGWNGLGNSINQITRELPAFAVSAQTGFLGISNNIPILVDEINKLRAANAALAAEGKKTIPVWRQLIRSFLSWQTVISLSITLMVVYGKEIGEFIGNMLGVRRAVDQARAAHEAYNEALKSDEFKDAIQEVIELRSGINLLNRGLISSDDVVRRYNETIGQTTGELKTLAEVESFLAKNANAYIQFTLNKAAANLQLAKAAEMAAKIQEDSTKHAAEFVTFWDQFKSMVSSGNLTGILNPALAGLNAEYNKLIQQAGEERRKAMVAQNMKDRDAYIQNAEALLAEAAKYADQLNLPTLSGLPSTDKEKNAKALVDAELKLQQFRAQAIADNNRKIAENDKATFEERADAADIYREQMEKVIDLQRQMDLQAAESAAERQLAEEKASQAMIELADEDKDILISILQDQLDEEDRLRAEAWANRKLQLEQQQHEELQILNNLYISREIGEKEYQERRKQVAYDYARAYINQEIAALEELIDVERKRGKDVGESERELARLKMKYSEEATKKQIDDIKKVEEAEKEINKLKKKLAKEVFDLGVALFEANVERDLQEIDRQEKQLDEQTERELEAINNSTLSEEEKFKRTSILEANADRQRQILERRRQQAELKQARIQKGARLMEATVSTAAGVARAFADYVFPYSAIIAGLVGALGAVQIATIAATPLPRYFKGTSSSTEGIAHVGEKGTELLRFPDGSEVLTPNRDTLTWLPKGTEVLTNEQTKRYLVGQSMPPKDSEFPGLNGLTRSFEENVAVSKKLLSAFENNKVYSTIITEKGWRSQHNRMSDFRKYLRQNGIR